MLFSFLGFILGMLGLSYSPSHPHELYKIQSAQDVINLFPLNPEKMQQQFEYYMQEVKCGISEIKQISIKDRTFSTVALKLDTLLHRSDFAVFARVIHAITYMHPNEHMVEKANQLLIKANNFFVDIMTDKDLYEVFASCLNNTSRTLIPEERYFYDQTILAFKRAGLDLQPKQLKKLKKLQTELTHLEITWQKNITADNTQIQISIDELAGMDQEFIKGLTQTESGDYILNVNSTVSSILENAQSVDTRRNVYKAFFNRAYPANKKVLEQLIEKRNALAQLLGYPTFAHYDLANQMAASPEKVQAFLDELHNKALKKEKQELKMLTAELPASVQLTHNGKIHPWDRLFLIRSYKNKHLNLDMNTIEEYFPFEETMQGLLAIYESFLSLEFHEVKTQGFWSNEVRLLEVYQKEDNSLIGYVLLDLFPRRGKFPHCCSYDITPTTFDDNGQPNRSLMWVLTNFPRPRNNKPALLPCHAVKTFFHEFGHALHGLLGRTKIAGQFGHKVKTDFLETPSQLLEEWLSDRQIVKMLSQHYQTGASIPEDILDRLLNLESLFIGSWIVRQTYLAQLSLSLFGTKIDEDLDSFHAKIYQKIKMYELYDYDLHDYASFGHIAEYKAKYYSYLWSKVFAADLASEIKKHGFLNPAIGKKYVDEVIGRGGSANPNDLLFNFLGRQPSNAAFFQWIET